MLHYFQVRLEEGAGTDDKVNFAVPSALVFKSAKIVDVDGIDAHNTNFVTFKVLGSDQATTLAEWSTQDTAQGALTAGTSADLVDQNKADKGLFAAGSMIEVSLASAGGGRGVNCMIVIEFESARTY